MDMQNQISRDISKTFKNNMRSVKPLVPVKHCLIPDDFGVPISRNFCMVLPKNGVLSSHKMAIE